MYSVPNDRYVAHSLRLPLLVTYSVSSSLRCTLLVDSLHRHSTIGLHHFLHFEQFVLSVLARVCVPCLVPISSRRLVQCFFFCFACLSWDASKPDHRPSMPFRFRMPVNIIRVMRNCCDFASSRRANYAISYRAQCTERSAVRHSQPVDWL